MQTFPTIGNWRTACKGCFSFSQDMYITRWSTNLKPLRKPIYLCSLFVALILIKIYGNHIEYSSMICPIRISNYILFIIDISIGYLFAVGVFKALPPCRPVEFCGTHSIVLLFFLRCISYGSECAVQEVRTILSGKLLPCTVCSSMLMPAHLVHSMGYISSLTHNSWQDKKSSGKSVTDKPDFTTSPVGML